MSKKIKWLFETNNSGRWKGFNDSDIERFKKGRYLSLTREVIQNSNDAILDKTLPVRIDFDLLKVNVADIPDIDGLRDKFIKCLPHAKADNNPEAEQIKVKTSTIGIVKDGRIELDLVKGQRLQLDAELSRESLGAYRVYAKEIS